MWIEELPSGKYRFVERYKDLVTGKWKKATVTADKRTGTAKRIAIDELNKKVRKYQVPGELLSKQINLQRLVSLYLNYQKNVVKASTYERNYRFCNQMLTIFDQNMLVNELSASYVKSCLISSGKSNTTINEFIKRFKALVRWGYENDYIKSVDWLHKIKPFQELSKKEKVQDKYLEPEEISILLGSMKNERWKFLTEFMLLSGLRIGECLALTTNDVDISNKVIHVNKTYDHINHLVTTPKTLTSNRDVFMQNELVSLANTVLTVRQLTVYNNNISKATNILFLSENGSRASLFAYNKYLKDMGKKYLNRKHITSHILRHTHASLLLASGVSIDTISRRLGHENSLITKEIYLHVTKKLISKDNEQLKNISLI